MERVKVLILFTFVPRLWHYPILNPVRMKHHCGEIKEEKAKSPSGRGDRGKENKNAHRDRARHPENSRQYVSLINVSQPGNDTKHNRHHIACFAFRGLCRAAYPIATVAAFGIFR